MWALSLPTRWVRVGEQQEEAHAGVEVRLAATSRAVYACLSNAWPPARCSANGAAWQSRNPNGLFTDVIAPLRAPGGASWPRAAAPGR